MNKVKLVNELAEKMNIMQEQSRQFVNVFQKILMEVIKQETPVMP
ncbi:HU family DNA-binding protein [Parabacteroides timonensis]|nr:HU family DNA-binding protein [Parabacteroides timonensis]